MHPIAFLLFLGTIVPASVAFTIQPPSIPNANGNLRSNSPSTCIRKSTTNIQSHTWCTQPSKSRLRSTTDGADYAPSDVDNDIGIDDGDDVNGDANAEMEDEAFAGSANAGPNSDFESIPNGLGEWEEMHGNYVLRPPATTQEPRYVRLV
jgi:hypothetical protein